MRKDGQRSCQQESFIASSWVQKCSNKVLWLVGASKTGSQTTPRNQDSQKVEKIGPASRPRGSMVHTTSTLQKSISSSRFILWEKRLGLPLEAKKANRLCCWTSQPLLSLFRKMFFSVSSPVNTRYEEDSPSGE